MPFSWNEAIRILAAGGKFALAAVVGKSGSSPAAVGSIMLVDEAGAAFGTVGGGAIEAAAREAALRLMPDEGSETLHFDLGNESAAASGMICGGESELLLDVATPSDLSVFSAARECVASGDRGFLLYRIDARPRLLKFSRDPESETPVWDGAVRIPLRGRARLFIFGCGHVGVETARLASGVDFAVTVLDDRREFAAPGRFPGSSVVPLDAFDPLPPLGIGPDSSVVIATRGHLHDIAVLNQVLKTPAGYIGMIGSGRKRDATRARLIELGHAPSAFERVHSPIGLAIGSETPAEIAVSIVGELIRERALRRKAEPAVSRI